MNQEFYYGWPQELWDSLCDKAEDLLHEERLGTYIVGIYPAGERIYGLESYPPGLMCLYVDSVEALIDPFSEYKYKTGFNTFLVGHNCSPIIMVDLFKWVKWMFKLLPDWRTNQFLHAIPFGQHVIREDSGISDIMEACHQGMKEIKFACGWQPQKESSHLEFLFHRTMRILYHTNKFLPNINPEWDKVASFSDFYSYIDLNLYTLDIENRHKLLDNNNTIISKEAMEVFDMHITWPHLHMKQQTLKKISDSVMDFYRFQL